MPDALPKDLREQWHFFSFIFYCIINLILHFILICSSWGACTKLTHLPGNNVKGAALYFFERLVLFLHHLFFFRKKQTTNAEVTNPTWTWKQTTHYTKRAVAALLRNHVAHYVMLIMVWSLWTVSCNFLMMQPIMIRRSCLKCDDPLGEATVRALCVSSAFIKASLDGGESLCAGTVFPWLTNDIHSAVLDQTVSSSSNGMGSLLVL